MEKSASIPSGIVTGTESVHRLHFVSVDGLHFHFQVSAFVTRDNVESNRERQNGFE